MTEQLNQATLQELLQRGWLNKVTSSIGQPTTIQAEVPQAKKLTFLEIQSGQNLTSKHAEVPTATILAKAAAFIPSTFLESGLGTYSRRQRDEAQAAIRNRYIHENGTRVHTPADDITTYQAPGDTPLLQNSDSRPRLLYTPLPKLMENTPYNWSPGSSYRPGLRPYLPPKLGGR